MGEINFGSFVIRHGALRAPTEMDEKALRAATGFSLTAQGVFLGQAIDSAGIINTYFS